jgi:hypothetical protein
MSRGEGRVQADVEAARACHGAGIVNRLNYHAEHSESDALNVGRLRADGGCDRLDGRGLGLRLLQSGQDALVYELCNP